jgi:ribosome recycling factor
LHQWQHAEQSVLAELMRARRACRMSPETRKAMARLAHQVAEQARVAVRQVRHKALAEVKKQGASVGEDEKKRTEKSIDEITKRVISQVDEALARKEGELEG